MTAPPWEAVLLDYGGTLDGDGIHWSVRFDRAFRAIGLFSPPEALQRAFRTSEDRLKEDPEVPLMGLEECLRAQVGCMLAELDPAGAVSAAEAARFLLKETREILARSAEVLRALHRHSRVGVLSNFTGNLERILHDEGLLPLVDAVFDSAVVGLRKPDPEFFRHALDALGARPDRALMVGDSIEMDLRPARSLGLATAWIEGAAPRQADFHPDFRLKNLRDLLTLWGAVE